MQALLSHENHDIERNVKSDRLKAIGKEGLRKDSQVEVKSKTEAKYEFRNSRKGVIIRENADNTFDVNMHKDTKVSGWVWAYCILEVKRTLQRLWPTPDRLSRLSTDSNTRCCPWRAWLSTNILPPIQIQYFDVKTNATKVREFSDKLRKASTTEYLNVRHCSRIKI